MVDTAATRAAAELGIDHEVVEYGPVGGLAEAAEKRGVPIPRIIKTLVVRGGDGDFLLVLVPGDRIIDWPRLRAHLGVGRLSLASEEEALAATGYQRGAITPLGTPQPLPIIADESITGLMSLGGGAHGVAIHGEASVLLPAVGAVVAAVTRLAEA